QTVTVIDDVPPTISCPANVITDTNPNDCFATGVQLGSPVTGDNCNVASTSNDAPVQFPVGTTTVRWTVTDIYGNSNTCSQTVTVVDNQVPTVTCPANITTNVGSVACSITALDLGAPVTNDNCGVASL